MLPSLYNELVKKISGLDNLVYKRLFLKTAGARTGTVDRAG